MPNTTELTSPDEAKAALASVEQMTITGMKRGLYSRRFAVVMSLWAGVLATLVGLDSPIWLLWLFAGIFAFFAWRRKQGAWIQEVQSPRELWRVIPLGLLGGAVFIGGNVAQRDFGLGWAPFVAGAVLAVGLFLLTELGHRAARARIERSAGS